MLALATAPNGTPVSRAFSHELNEMMIDPYGNLRYEGYLVEVWDPVADVDARLRGVAVADFTTPYWYVWDSHGPWDAAAVLAGDHSTTPGGYSTTTFLKTHQRVPLICASRHCVVARGRMCIPPCAIGWPTNGRPARRRCCAGTDHRRARSVRRHDANRPLHEGGV